jgi:hypothetical protein
MPSPARYFAVADPEVTISSISAATPCPRSRSAMRTLVVGLLVRKRIVFPMLRRASSVAAAPGVVSPPM